MKLKQIWNDIKKINNDNINKQTELNKIINFNSTANPLIEVKNLSMAFKSKFKNKKIIFENINFKIYENEIIALLGPNGSGKTTLVEIITSIKKQVSGEVIFNYKTNDNQEQVGVQFQDLSFPKGLTVKDFIDFQILLMQKQISENLLNEMLLTFKLKDFLNTKVSKLSGGQQQRLNVLIAMIGKPKVLFLDEFSTGLDIAVKNVIKEFILDYAKKNNITVILISHDIDIINQMANRFLLIANKQLIVDSDKKTIINKFGTISEFLHQYIR